LVKNKRRFEGEEMSLGILIGVILGFVLGFVSAAILAAARGYEDNMEGSK